MLKRKINIRAVVPVQGVIPGTSIIGCAKNLSLDTEQIRKCIVQKAIVDEVLENGVLRRLDLMNYDKIEKVEIPQTPVQEPVDTNKNLKEEKNEENVEEKNDHVEETLTEENEETPVEEVKVENEETAVEETLTEKIEEIPVEEPKAEKFESRKKKKH